MILKFKLAFRNVLRNRRRTTLNVLMIAGAISAIVVFKGFAANMLGRLQRVAINTQYGHIQIASLKTWNLTVGDTPKDRLIQLEPAVVDKIKADPEVDYVSGRLSFYGLISSGDQSLSARGVAYDPAVEVQMRDHMRIVDGRNLGPDSKFEIILGIGLKEQLGVKVGASVTLVAYTFDGAINAIDAEVVGIVHSGLSELDNTTFYLPLTTGQRLLDTNSIERAIVQLKHDDTVETTIARLTPSMPNTMSPRGWKELASYYRQVTEYFHVQNLVIQWILMLLAMLSIANVLGMSVSERTGEIGTVRALGDTQADVMTQFLIEGLILGFMGSIVGCLNGFILAKIVTALHIPLAVPGASLPLPVEIEVLPRAFADGIALTAVISVFATLLPAYRASKLKIIDSLRHNI